MNRAGIPDRATITDRVARLLGERPWAAYDEQSADAIAARVGRVEVDTARQVRSYERGHKARADVVQAAERRIDAAGPACKHDGHGSSSGASGLRALLGSDVI